MKNSSIWMPFYVGDYLRDTMHLTTEAHGAYVLLIMHYWTKRGPLPDDPAYLSAVAKLSQTAWQTHSKTIANFFHVEGGYWIHPRIDKELSVTSERSKAGKEGAKRRWNGKHDGKMMANGMANPMAKGMANEWQSDANHSHSTKREREPSSVVEERPPQIPPMNRKNFDALADRLNIPKDCSEWVWNTFDAKNWVDSRGQIITKVEPLLLNMRKTWQAKQSQAKTPATANKPPGYDPLQDWKQSL